jgi:hypothetical protein
MAKCPDLNCHHLADYELRDFTTRSRPNSVHVYFRETDHGLLRRLQEEPAVVVGCVAWLTEPRILHHLSRMSGASILVQKEDFLRPDAGSSRASLRRMYDMLARAGGNGGAVTGQDCPWLRWLPDGSPSEDRRLQGVRCVGRISRGGKTAPRMHHKFLVFCSRARDADGDIVLNPYAVWTGSFNFTVNATNSLENAVYIEDERIAEAYFGEWAQLAAISEPLDWEHEWIAPEWTVG